jgi:3-dehydroquinate synthase
MVVNIDLKKKINHSYKIYLGELENLDDILEKYSKIGIITNTKVAGLHLKYLLEQINSSKTRIITIPDGEEYKNLATVENILESLFNHSLNEKPFDRKSVLIGFGGGVVGDITGFTASIYQRGIDFIQIPTTLLAQVDASVGGKTGVNNKFGKNLIGAFHQPKAVFIDPQFLQTLPIRELRAGFAEMVKMAVTFDKDFFEELEKSFESSNIWLENFDNDKFEKYIKRAVELKAEIVSKDEKEQGVRASLNYGHTFGHIIENETGYSKFLHGEAVAMGMVIANNLSVELGKMSQTEADRIYNLLKKSGLPTDYKISNIDAFYQKLFLDKKSFNSKIKFVVPRGIGDFEFADEVSEITIKKVLKRFS